MIRIHRVSGHRATIYSPVPTAHLIGVALLWVCLLSAQVARSAELSGRIDKYMDGDTFEIWKQSIRLADIDAPEFSQDCRDHAGKRFNCGTASLNFLKTLIGNRELRCTGTQEDAYGRLLAQCYAGDVHINAHMVNAGWAVAFVKYADTFVKEEAAAKAQKRGLWAGTFERPVDYRRARWDDARTQASPAGDDCVIKGNINSKGDRIYHTPWGSRHYTRTRINTAKGERWFCDEAEALAAGWRAPYR